MPSIEITDRDFKRMQRLAEPLVHTPTTLVTEMLDVFEEHKKNADSHRSNSKEAIKSYSFEAPPPLAYAKFLSGMIGVRQPEKANWNSMAALCLELVLEQRNMSPEQAGKLIDLNVQKGRKVDSGYKYIEKFDISYQGVSAEHAALVIGKTARFLGEAAYVDFIWRERDDAFAPGKAAALSYDLG